MVVLDDPPPVYEGIDRSSTKDKATPRQTPTLLGLPEHILLTILSYLPLPTLCLHVRLTNRQLLLFSSVILRRSLLPVWESKKRPAFTSDPMGKRRGKRDGEQQHQRSRELAVLDLFIAACVHEAVRAHESELHLLPSVSHSAERDIFDFMQPKARLEDLVIRYGREDGTIAAESAEQDEWKVSAGDLSVTLLARSAKLLLPFLSQHQKGVVSLKTVTELPRRESDSLEEIASGLAGGLATMRLMRHAGKEVFYVKE
ncbi:hypothetical protein T439DRAFT_325445 [Meredithblackwellia eburnea MCA 4105]